MKRRTLLRLAALSPLAAMLPPSLIQGAVGQSLYYVTCTGGPHCQSNNGLLSTWGDGQTIDGVSLVSGDILRASDLAIMFGHVEPLENAIDEVFGT